MREQQLEFQGLCFSLLFRHFYIHDILIGTLIPEEKMFAEKTKRNLHSYLSSNAPINDKKNKLIKGDLELASEIMSNMKLPLIFELKTMKIVTIYIKL